MSAGLIREGTTAAQQHDLALFDELMREELRRQPVRPYAIATLVTGFLGGLIAQCSPSSRWSGSGDTGSVAGSW